MRKLPSVSIIIPTFNRKDVLREALISLNGVDYPRDRLEVVVVSDGSNDGTNKMVPSIVKQLNYSLVFIKKRRGGISRAKNTAIKKARGKIIVSTDDDCLFEKDWLKKLIRPLDNPKVGCVGGPDKAIEKESILAKSIDYAFASFVGSGGIHGRPLKIRVGRIYPVGCNMAFSKIMVKEIGFFDASLAPGEETDFDHRVEKAGFELIHVPEAFVWHRPRNSFKSLIPRSFKRGAARVEMVRRHPQFVELVYFLPAAMVLTTLILLGLSVFQPVFLKILIGLLVFYFLMILSAGLSAFLSHRHLAYFLLVPLLISIQHSCHGVGFLVKAFQLLEDKKR